MDELPVWLSRLCERALRPEEGKWASVSHVIARQAYDLDTDRDYAVDLLGLLIDEVVRLTDELNLSQDTRKETR